MLTYSKQGLALTEMFESACGPKLIAYADTLRDNIPTVGWGHTGPDVKIRDVWTRAQCVEALQKDIFWASNVVNNLVHITLNQDEFDALVDFVYNVGIEAFASSTLLKDLNSNDVSNAIVQFDLWDHAGGKVVAGLLRRRQAETVLFKSKVKG